MVLMKEWNPNLALESWREAGLWIRTSIMVLISGGNSEIVTNACAPISELPSDISSMIY